jgi:hypothetical protein
MLSHYLHRHMRRILAPMLFDDPHPAPRPRSARTHIRCVDRPTPAAANYINGLRSEEGRVQFKFKGSVPIASAWFPSKISLRLSILAASSLDRRSVYALIGLIIALLRAGVAGRQRSSRA